MAQIKHVYFVNYMANSHPAKIKKINDSWESADRVQVPCTDYMAGERQLHAVGAVG